MTTFWIIVGIVVYIIMGGISAAAVNDEELNVIAFILWPIGLVALIVCGVYTLAKELGEWIIDAVKYAITSAFDKEEKQ